VMPCIGWEDVGLKTNGEKSTASGSEGECNVSPAVYITSLDDGCWAHAGELTDWKSQGFNLQSPGCDSLGTSMHEFLHTLGQLHEQSRPDRDTFVTVEFEKIQENYKSQFEVDAKEDTVRPYDMLSLMHYDSHAFSTDGSATITAKPAAYGLYTNNTAEYHKYRLGNRIGMTQTDADQLAAQYSCTASVLQPAGPCVDKTKDDGTKWADIYGQDCNLYRSLGLDECKKYISNVYCCGCDGGIQEQIWAQPK